jgi:small subunit ribosomal protein S1
MSDTDKPQDNTTPQTTPGASSDKAEQPPPRPRPAPAEPARRGSEATELTPAERTLQRDRPARSPRNMEKVPSLEHELNYGASKRAAHDRELDQDLEREMLEAMGGTGEQDLKQLYGEDERRSRQQQAETLAAGPRKGRVISVRGKDVFVDVGGRTQGVLPVMQFEGGPPAVGAEVEVHIEGYDPDGFLILTRRGAVVEADWSSVATGMLVEARVTGTNKGGLSVEVNGIRGFMPVSQIDLYRVDDMEQFVNQRLRCLVTEVDREERNLVVSRRALLEKERAEGREKLWGELAEGQVREGIVRSIKPFGAFVDLGGADGLLPIGEMSWSRINDPSDVVKEGQKVRVAVLRLDRDARKITLGLKQLSASPWDEAPLNYPPGSIVQGKVTRIMDFGAFVEIEPGVEGLVHVSEISPTRIRRVADVIKVGQDVQVKVLSIDSAARRMALSLKAAQAAPPPPEAEDEEEEEMPPVERKQRDTPLRGGVGNKEFKRPQQ